MTQIVETKTNQQKIDTKISETNLNKKSFKKTEPVKIMSLMGLQQVGQCLLIEYKNDMIIVDAGVEFPDYELPGASYIIPDISYVKQNLKKLRWILITHWHLDHVGALKDILPELDRPVIYTTPLTLWIIKRTFQTKEEMQKVRYHFVNPDSGERVKLWVFEAEFMRVNHNIPESMAIAIHTPHWTIFDTWDFKVDFTPAIDKPADLARLAKVGERGVKLYIGDSLGVTKKWASISEKIIWKNLDKLIKNLKWRIIVATFASNVWRIIQLINSAINNWRVVFLDGRSMVNNVEICRQLGYIKVPETLVRKIDDDVESMPDDKVMIICTGAQGEEYSALARMARWEHAKIQLRPWDNIILSSSVIPWNELQARKMINWLLKKWANVITNNDIDIHASWHWGEDDHKLFLNLIKPEYVLPYFMDAYHRYAHGKVAQDMGWSEDKILMPNKNWHIIEMYPDKVVVSDKTISVQQVIVDGLGKTHLSWEYVMKARKIMANEWVVALVLKIDADNKKLIWNVQIESRWFVYSSEVKKVHTLIVDFVKKRYNKYLLGEEDIKNILKNIKEELWYYIMKNIWRKPMIVMMYVFIKTGKNWTVKSQSETKIVM